MKEYWEESLQEVFDEHGLKLTYEIVKDIMFISEMESEATGRIYISDPRKDEIANLKREITKLTEKYEHQLQGIKEGVAERRGVETKDVVIDEHGHVTYYRR